MLLFARGGCIFACKPGFYAGLVLGHCSEVNELGKAASYHLRLLFVEVCIILKREMIKTDVFETLCRETLMSIKEDPVSNVRETYERATRNGLL